MLVAYLVLCLINTGCSLKIPIPTPLNSPQALKCLEDVVRQHFTQRKVLTYVGNKVEDVQILETIHTPHIVSVISKRSLKKVPIPHEAYLISGKNATYFYNHFPSVTKESSWNPLARFLVIVRDLNEREMRIIFDIFLKHHVKDVVIMNATAKDPDLYGYNPFAHYNCGKRYNDIFFYGKCSIIHELDLYPKKIITGLRNCTFNVLITKWPPYTVFSVNNTDNSSLLSLGAEPYLFRLIGEMQGFKINTINDYDEVEDFPTVDTNMEAVGSLKKVQDHEVDIVLGGMLLTPSRAVAFSYIYGHLAYTDEIRFVVRRASFVPPWKNVYLEFDSTIWALLILSLMLYSVLVIFLLATKDKGNVVLVLVGHMVLHGHSIRSRWAVKCVLILWVWFTYLINTFYQSSLFSLTTNPAQEYQIMNEEDIARHQLKPCFSSVMGKYYEESVDSESDGYHQIDDCFGLMESVAAVAKSKDLFTIVPYGQYLYNKENFYDEYGNPLVITLPKPYSKVMYSIFMYKGFPLGDELSLKSLRLRENGLVDKVISDINYRKQIKHRFREQAYRSSFAIPWRIYIVGCSLAVIIFIIEINMPRVS